ncbi:LysR family transcriptional regulator [Marinobacter sp. CHS3-4]|uniref:LysR family transcriptional regulator n=1 Tax=Marinobacter sp. CHS3-4 TaxID=3045174 RepID=UPI0024B592BF|nr:LysR family transcriptional regulator [Marinobacter sp. CHS3-4]MDI9246420.1 LysR substrate-binding domain-containing protein [Marinobacter sp. CHS3-4]
MDRIDAMRAFLQVVQDGSFTRAAERLTTSPQLVSKYVSQLEQLLGVRLLNRTTRRVNLTEAGHRYFQSAQQILADLDDLEHQIGDLQPEASGLLRISAPVSFAIHHMEPLLSAFRNAHPGVEVDLQLNDRKVDIVEEGFDVALRIGRLKSSSLIAKRVAPIRLVFCASPDYLARHGTPEHPEDLQNHHYLHYSYMDSSAIPSLQKWFSGSSRIQRVMSSNNGDVLIAAAISGAGIALQPTFLCGPAIREGKLQVLLEQHEPEPMALYAVYAHRQLMASKVRVFVDFIDGFYGKTPHWDELQH